MQCCGLVGVAKEIQEKGMVKVRHSRSISVEIRTQVKKVKRQFESL